MTAEGERRSSAGIRSGGRGIAKSRVIHSPALQALIFTALLTRPRPWAVRRPFAARYGDQAVRITNSSWLRDRAAVFRARTPPSGRMPANTLMISERSGCSDRYCPAVSKKSISASNAPVRAARSSPACPSCRSKHGRARNAESTRPSRVFGIIIAVSEGGISVQNHVRTLCKGSCPLGIFIRHLTHAVANDAGCIDDGARCRRQAFAPTTRRRSACPQSFHPRNERLYAD